MDLAELAGTATPSAFGLLPDTVLESVLPFHSTTIHHRTRALRDLVQQYGDGPFAMRVGSDAELFLHASILHSVCAAHAAYARRHVEKFDNFPYEWCGRASTNVMLSLVAHGYPNAAVARADPPRDHSYVILPFVVHDQQGVIIGEPTLGQMPRIGDITVEIKMGTRWEYRPGWKEGIDLYPDRFLWLGRIKELLPPPAMETLTTSIGPTLCSPEAYFHTAFSHPVPIFQRPNIGEILKRVLRTSA